MSDIALANTRVEDNLKLVHHVIWDKFIASVSEPGGYEYDDLFQVGSIGLLKAARSYNESEAKFSTYAVTCIKNEIINYISSENTRRKNKIPMSDEIILTAFDASANDSYNTSETSMYITELFESLEKKNVRNLNLKKSVVMLLYQGYKIKEIAKLLNLSERKVRRYAKSIADEVAKLNNSCL